MSIVLSQTSSCSLENIPTRYVLSSTVVIVYHWRVFIQAKISRNVLNDEILDKKKNEIYILACLL